MRRLAAIMFTDTVGSTESAQRDEARALRLRDEQEEIVRPLFAEHQGREIKSTGDGFLAEFDSALRAVECATDIQHRLFERNSQPGVTPIRLRIGIHLGDVEERASDIFGDAVNIAARIEPLAAPGGVCISGPVFDQIRNKLPNPLEKLSPVALKGVLAPVDVYRVLLPWASAGAAADGTIPTGIAVLPFSNISTDPQDAYFADGLTEELITVLSKVRGLRVIARTSVMPYRSTAKGIAQIGGELRVASILEGSVRKAGNRLRITAQLIAVRSEDHLWAETYDRNLDDVFAVQADVAKRVADALNVAISRPTETELSERPVVRPESYLAFLKGRSLLYYPTSNDGTARYIEESKEQFRLAISLDPKNAAAYAGLSEATFLEGLLYTETPREVWIRSTRELAARAIELDPGGAEGHCSMAIALYNDNQYEAADQEFQRALALNPSYAQAHYHYGDCLMEQARATDALRELGLAEALDPLSRWILGKAILLDIVLRRLDSAKERIERGIKLGLPSGFDHILWGWYYWAKSDRDALLQQLELGLRSDLTEFVKDAFAARIYAATGQPDRARALLPRLEAVPDTADKFRWLTETYAELGDLDGCFRVADRALEQHKFDPILFRLDPKFEHVRRDPRFSVVLHRMNLA